MLEYSNYDEQLKLILQNSHGNFLMIQTQHCRLLDGDGNAAIIFAYFLNLLRMKASNIREREQLKVDDLWFCCPAKHIQKALGMGEYKQRSSVEKLKNKGLIEISHRIGNMLWVRIRTENLEGNQKEDGSKKLNEYELELLDTLPYSGNK